MKTDLLKSHIDIEHEKTDDREHSYTFLNIVYSRPELFMRGPLFHLADSFLLHRVFAAY